jgi:DNA-binding cell septation regulator SpoVG
MIITEVTVRLQNHPPPPGRPTFLGYASIVFDHEFIVRDLKVLQRGDRLIVGMPSSREADSCPVCYHKTPLADHFCGHCGRRLAEGRRYDPETGDSLDQYRDVAHPITTEFRRVVEAAVLRAYVAESNRARAIGASSNGRVNQI